MYAGTNKKALTSAQVLHSEAHGRPLADPRSQSPCKLGAAGLVALRSRSGFAAVGSFSSGR